MTTILAKRFTKLRKELQFYQSELEYVQEILKEEHHTFEKFQRKYCEENNIDLAKLNSENSEVVHTMIETNSTKKHAPVDFKAQKQKNQMKKIYKQLVKKLHPDVGGDEKEFKKVTTAMSQNNFEKILDICDEHAILIKVDEETISLLKKQIKETKRKIDKQKSTYSWKLYSCEENTKCKNNVIKQFLKQLFNYGG
jgi:predicted membrane GTPase involved in stress response